VHNVVFAKMTESEPLKGCALPAIAIQSAVECSAKRRHQRRIIAEISLHALRATNTSGAKYTPPVPAPNSSTIFPIRR